MCSGLLWEVRQCQYCLQLCRSGNQPAPASLQLSPQSGGEQSSSVVLGAAVLPQFCTKHHECSVASTATAVLWLRRFRSCRAGPRSLPGCSRHRRAGCRTPPCPGPCSRWTPGRTSPGRRPRPAGRGGGWRSSLHRTPKTRGSCKDRGRIPQPCSSAPEQRVLWKEKNTSRCDLVRGDAGVGEGGPDQ